MKVSVNKRDVAREFKRLDKLLAEVSQQAFVASKRASESYAAKVKSGIGTTSTPAFVGKQWLPLSEKWKAMKKSNKDKFWIETGEIFRDIHVNIIQKTLLYIHLFSGINSGSAAFNKAHNNEYGSHLAAPRPLFKPAANLFSIVTGVQQRRLKENSKEYMFFKAAVKSAVRKVYGQ